MYLSTSTSTEDFPEMYLSTFQVLYKLYLSTDVLKYKVLLPGSGVKRTLVASDEIQINVMQNSVVYGKWPNVVDMAAVRIAAVRLATFR